MLGGVLLFGGVSWFVHQTPDWTPADPVVTAKLKTMGRIVGGLATFGLMFLYTRFRNASSASQASTLAILAWALGESVALFGGAYYFMTGVASFYIAGVLLLTLALVGFPPPPNR